MHNIHIVTSVVDEASGPSYSVTRLAEALAARGNQSEIYSLAGSTATNTRHQVTSRTFNCSLTGLPWLSRLSFSADLRDALAASAKSGVIMHNHGLWRMPNIYPGHVAAKTQTKLIVSPRGMLGPAALEFSRIQKRLFWTFAQKSALEAVSCFHATSEAELEDIRAFGERAPVAIVPNGIDVPSIPPPLPKRSVGRARTVLYLGRIHPKKGIDRLLKAWAKVAIDKPEWSLRIIGPSERGYGDELRTLSGALGLERVTFENPVYGEEKYEAYREADLFVLPTLNENFGMVVAEALAEATPVISTNGAPWKGLDEHGCGWWVDQGVDPLSEVLNLAMGLGETELYKMGVKGQAWMRRDFSWEMVAKHMEDVYRWSLGAADRPDFVTE